MLKKNKSNFCLVALKRKKKARKKTNLYDFVITKKSRHSKYFVLEKLGSFDFIKNRYFLNNYRLIYWMQFNVGFSPKAWKFLNMYIKVINNVK